MTRKNTKRKSGRKNQRLYDFTLRDFWKSRDFWSWTLRLLAAFVFIQSLFFKFSGSDESVYIFSQMGMEPWGRFFIGSLELLAAVLMFIRPTIFFGTLLSFALMAGAIIGHITRIGIEVYGDGGFLFFLAVFIFIASAVVFYLESPRFPSAIKKRIPGFLIAHF